MILVLEVVEQQGNILGFSSNYECYDNLTSIPVYTSFNDTYTISVT